MSRYFLHLRDSSEEVLDSEGRELEDLRALEKVVLDGARDIFASDIKSRGLMDLRYRIDAEDGQGKVVHTLSFAEAVRIIQHAP